jgi:hypothetical protein
MWHKNKKAAIELSVGTIVVIVIAMSMLILGLILVKNIFSGATQNVDDLNIKVKDEIKKLFSDNNEKMVLYVKGGSIIEIKQGETYGIGFGIRNTEKGSSTVGKFVYTVVATSVESGCNLPLETANSYIRLHQTESFDLSPGSDPFMQFVQIRPTESAPLCQIGYRITVTKDGASYTGKSFDIQITG